MPNAKQRVCQEWICQELNENLPSALTPRSLFMDTHITHATAELYARAIADTLKHHHEWLCAETDSSSPAHSISNASFALRSIDCDVRVAQERVLLSLLGERGTTIYRVNAWSYKANCLRLVTSRRADGEHATLTLTPRASVADAALEMKEARLRACAQLAATACDTLGARWNIEHIGLSKGARRNDAGRFARIVLVNRNARVALTCDLTSSGEAAVTTTQGANLDSFFASSLLWFARCHVTKKTSRSPRTSLKLISVNNAAPQLWFVAAPHRTADLATRCALLRDVTRNSIHVFRTNDDYTKLEAQPTPDLESTLQSSSNAQRPRPATAQRSDIAQRIYAFAPDAIDIIWARHGETLRFHGLAFARVRRLMNRTHVWLGVALARNSRGKLPHYIGDANDEINVEDWRRIELTINELVAHRRHDATNRTHALYRAAPEAWLETVLRRDITPLDPGLRLAPLHAQVRVFRQPQNSLSVRPVDLLAVRRDGRLVVIEIKVAEDIALPVQAADYWRRIETLRRAGQLDLLFDDVTIADESPLIYAVAPGLRFARTFAALSRELSPRIELYRFDINEDWRTGVRVMRRLRA